jgi:hypothetical protein
MTLTNTVFGSVWPVMCQCAITLKHTNKTNEQQSKHIKHLHHFKKKAVVIRNKNIFFA